MLPGCSRSCAPEGGEAQSNAHEQLQDSITVATVDSYQACSCHMWNLTFPGHHYGITAELSQHAARGLKSAWHCRGLLLFAASLNDASFLPC